MRHFIPLLVFLLCCPGIGIAGETVAEKTIVTASRIAEAPAAVTQQVTVIDREALEKNQYENLADLLQNYGIAISSYGPSQTTSQVYLRGFASALSDPLDSCVQVLVNGSPVGTVNLAEIPAEGIERIEILSGPASVQYGSSAMGGVINIIPKRGEAKTAISAEAGGGTWHSWRAIGSLSGEKSGFDFSASAGWNRQGANYTTGDGKLYQDTEAKSRTSYIFNMGYSFNKENRIGAILLGADDWGIGQNQSLKDEQKYNGLDFTAKRVNSAFSATYDGGLETAGLKWELRYFNAYDLYKSIYPADNPMFLSDNSIDVNQTGGQGQLSWNRDFLTLTGGVDYAHNRYAAGFSPAYTQNDTGLFGLAKLNFWNNLLVISGGVRHDDYQFTVNGNSQSQSNTAFSAGLLINPLSWLGLRANWAESFKMPSGLYVVGYDGPYGVEGNSSLEPERGYGWDAGAEIHYGTLTLGLTWFSTQYTNKFLYYTLPNGKSRYYNADGSTWLTGLEGKARLDLGALFDWDFSLAPWFYITALTDFTDPQGDMLYNTRNLTASWGLDFDYPEFSLSASLKCNYLGYQKEMVFGDNYERLPDKWTGGKTVIDFFLSKGIYDFTDGGALSVKAAIRNLTSENHAYRHDYPMPGRSFYVGLRYDY